MNPWTAKEVLQKIFTPKQISFLLKSLYSNYVIEENDYMGTDASPALLTMPLMLAAGLDPHIFGDIRKERYCKDILYPDNKNPLFLGAGSYSTNSVAKLHQRLQYAIIELGGEQQNGGMGTEFDEQSSKESEQNIKNVLRDIIHAFGYTAGDL